MDLDSWDEYGTTLRMRGLDDAGVPWRYLDLRTVPGSGRFVPATHPANLQFWTATDVDGSVTLNSTAFVVNSIVLIGLDRVGRRLESPGLHRLLYIRDLGNDQWNLRLHTFGPGTPECDSALLKPMSQRDWLARKAGKSDRFPHECPRCKGPAFVGAVLVDCQRRCH